MSFGSSSAQGGAIVGGLEVAIERVEEPERGVGGVVEAFVFAIGEEVGDQAVADVVGEGAQDPAGFVVAAGGEGEAFEADHGVAAPIGEPMVAGDDRAHFIAGGRARAASSTRPAGVMMNWSAASTSSGGGAFAGAGDGRPRAGAGGARVSEASALPRGEREDRLASSSVEATRVAC